MVAEDFLQYPQIRPSARPPSGSMLVVGCHGLVLEATLPLCSDIPALPKRKGARKAYELNSNGAIRLLTPRAAPPSLLHRCCWVLMALLFVGGVMNVLWIALLALLILFEK